MVHVRTKIKKPKKELLKKIKELSVATVYEAYGRKGAVDYNIKPIAKGFKVCGTALTVQCAPGDNLMLHKALQVAEEGDVIVADVGGAYNYGYWGELMAISAKARQVEGLVIDGGIRDSREIIELGFPVFARNICICGTKKETLGLINYPLVFGGVVINPGDIVLGDDDGIVIIKREDGEEALQRARQRVEAEEKKAGILKQGITSVEYNNLDKVFDKLGLVEE